MLNEDLIGRLQNWKFQSARKHVDNSVTPEDRKLIEALAECFGDIGWFDGYMGVIITASLEVFDIGVPDDNS